MESQQAYFQRLFAIANGNNGNQNLGGKDAVVFLQKSGIDRKYLRTIWELSDQNKAHALNFESFCIAMKYVGLAQNGQIPTPTLLQGVSNFPSPIFKNIEPQKIAMIPQLPMQTPPNELNNFAIQNNSNSLPMYASKEEIENTLNSGNITWRPKKMLLKYSTLLFQSLVKDGSNNTIPGKDAVAFFRKTKLENSILKLIWNNSSIRKVGSLNFVEFTVAIQFVAIAFSGAEISINSLNNNQLTQGLPLSVFPGSGIEIPVETTSTIPNALNTIQGNIPSIAINESTNKNNNGINPDPMSLDSSIGTESINIIA